MFIEDTTPIAALTVADLKKLLKGSIREQKIEAIPPVTTPGKRYVYGLKGIQDLFGVCHLTAQRYKDGFLTPPLPAFRTEERLSLMPIWSWTSLRTISMRTLNEIDPIAAITVEAVAKENTVLYLDYVLSAKQFQMRYVEGKISPIIHRFPDTLLRSEIRSDAILDSVAAEAPRVRNFAMSSRSKSAPD